jgi:predicted DNA-binding transcriptional regulator AlpA
MENMELPKTGFLRAAQILGDPKRGILGLIPVSRSTWWLGVKSGRFPRPVKIPPGVTVWRVEDIKDLLARIGANDGSR